MMDALLKVNRLCKKKEENNTKMSIKNMNE